MASKYGNVKCTYQGLKFDSKLEMQRWIFLQDCQAKDLIDTLERQVKFYLTVNDVLICTYIADFHYYSYSLPGLVTEDAKGIRTAAFNLKAKLFKALLKREIKIIDKANVTNLIPVKKPRKRKL